MKVWIVGIYRGGTYPNAIWDLCGVFDDKQKAIDGCRDEKYFVGPIEMNVLLPDESQEWPGVIYPKANIKEYLAKK